MNTETLKVYYNTGKCMVVNPLRNREPRKKQSKEGATFKKKS